MTKESPTSKSAAKEREERQAAALRKNLRKRKEQQRARQPEGGAENKALAPEMPLENRLSCD